jgi:hypothetical protein
VVDRATSRDRFLQLPMIVQPAADLGNSFALHAD